MPVVAVGSDSGDDFYTPPLNKVVSHLDGLPKGHDKVTTYGGGGGTPIIIKSGPLEGWSFGGGKRDEVFGNTHHPTIFAEPNTTVWGFPPITTSQNTDPSDADLRLYYESLPQNITRPGGELVEMMMTQFDVNTTLYHPEDTIRTPTLPFFFVSDNYTAFQMNSTIANSCGILLEISDPIPFNSTGNIQPESLVQFFRGDSAAIYLQGYDNTKELPGNPNLVPNPAFPPNASMDAWTCINSTIGESIPLMHGGDTFAAWKIALCIVVPIIFLVFLACAAWLFGYMGPMPGSSDEPEPTTDTAPLSEIPLPAHVPLSPGMPPPPIKFVASLRTVVTLKLLQRRIKESRPSSSYSSVPTVESWPGDDKSSFTDDKSTSTESSGGKSKPPSFTKKVTNFVIRKIFL